MLLVLFKLSFIHETVSQGGESVPAQFFVGRQETHRNLSRYGLHHSIFTPNANNIAICVLPQPASP